MSSEENDQVKAGDALFIIKCMMFRVSTTVE